jgi:hypothetical protein
LLPLRGNINIRSTAMPTKVQGEGDYESARRYNEKTREFVKDKQASGESLEAAAEEAVDELTPPEQEALRHAKHGEQDKRDAELLRKRESKS